MAKNKKEKARAENAFLGWKKHSAIIARVFVLAMVIVFPLFVLTGAQPVQDSEGNITSYVTNFYENMTNNKQNVFAFLCLGTLAALAVAYLRSMMDGNLPKIKGLIKRLFPHEIALIAFGLVLVISALQAAYPEYAWTGIPRRNGGALIYIGYIATFFIISRLYTPKKADALIACIVGAATAIIGILQFFGMDIFGLYPSTYELPPLDALLNALGPEFWGKFPYPHTLPGPYIIFYSTFGNTNFYSTYLGLVFVLGSIVFIRGRKKRVWALLPCTLITLYMALIGGTSSFVVGALAAFVVGLGWMVRDQKSLAKLCIALAGFALILYWAEATSAGFGMGEGAYSPWHSAYPFIAGVALILGVLLMLRPSGKEYPVRRVRIGWAVFLAAALIAGLVALPTVAETTGNTTLMEAAAVLWGDLTDEAGSGRGFIWKRAMQLVPERPILGYGPDNFAPVFEENFAEDRATSAYFPNTPIDKAHNEYIQLLVDTGVVGCAAFVAFIALLFWRFRKYWNNTLALAFGLAAFAYFTQAFFNITLPINGPVVWTLMGVFGATMRNGQWTMGE